MWNPPERRITRIRQCLIEPVDEVTSVGKLWTADKSQSHSNPITIGGQDTLRRVDSMQDVQPPLQAWRVWLTIQKVNIQVTDEERILIQRVGLSCHIVVRDRDGGDRRRA